MVQPHLIRRLQVDQGLNSVVPLLLPRPATARTSILALRLLLLLRPDRFRSPDGTRDHPWQPRAGGVVLPWSFAMPRFSLLIPASEQNRKDAVNLRFFGRARSAAR